MSASVACPGCGRRYGGARFEGGRTIRCTCGTRVGPRERIGPVPGEGGGRPRFLADDMLAHLARWLRIMGFDAASDPGAEDARLVGRALDEGRILLTRDRRLPEEWRIRNVVLLDEAHPTDQLRTLAGRLELDWEERLFTRCSRCNEPLRERSREEVRAAQEEGTRGGGPDLPPDGRGRGHGPRVPVPEDVLRRAPAFGRCPACGRVYWEGSHTRRIRARLERLLSPP